jgi:hypothetical protein
VRRRHRALRHHDAVVHLLRSAFEAAVHFDMRLPELFCGFPRVQGAPPIAYPVACMPQAWAAGAPFMLLQACLGVQVDGLRGEVLVERPRLPMGSTRCGSWMSPWVRTAWICCSGAWAARRDVRRRARWPRAAGALAELIAAKGMPRCTASPMLRTAWNYSV